MLASDSGLAMPLPAAFEPGFGLCPWEQPAPVHFPIPSSQSQSFTTGSDEPEPDRTVQSVEERRMRRMISNRESARRSRMRKQRHLEDLRSQVNRLRSENRDLANRLGAVTQHGLVFRRDNDRLRSESAVLRRRLIEIRQYLIFRRLQTLVTAPAALACGGFASGNEQNLAGAACGGFGTGNEQTLIV